MNKITYSSDNITPFGGLIFIHDLLKRNNVANCIDSTLGYRNYRAKYSYSDIVFSLLENSLCHGEYISDLKHLKEAVAENLRHHIPSHDTVEYAFQELKTKNQTLETKDKIVHEINVNNTLNELLVHICTHLQLLQPQVKDYVLDFDNVVLENQKQDAKKSYKMTHAYHPCFANIGNQTVYVENRNGNSPAKYQQKEALENCFSHLAKNNISIQSFRGDSASYQKEVIDLLRGGFKL